MNEHWGSFTERAAAATEHALRCGALRSVQTRTETIEQAGIRFLVHVLQSRDEKASASPVKGFNPFLPYDPDLFVADISSTHLCLLNKYNVLPNHLLIITRQFVDQESLLDHADFAALWFGLARFAEAQIDSFGFYNGGSSAGASQRHKHLQLTPLPFRADGPPTPVDAVLAGLAGRPGIVTAPQFPYLHAVVQLDFTWREPLQWGAHELWERYHALLEAVGLPASRGAGASQPGPYNLLVTRRWMMIVPRTQASFRSIPVNALGFAGSLLAKNEHQLRILRELGPLAVLAQVGVAQVQ